MRDELVKLRRRIAELEALEAERKQAEDVLRMSERDLAEAQELAHVGNWRWEIIPDEICWSDETYRLFGMEPGEAVDYAKYLCAVLPEDRDFVIKEVQEALDGIKPYENEHRIVRNGETRIHHTKGTVTQDEQGKPIRLFGVVQDITERKQTEESLRRSEEKLRLMFEALPEGITIIDLDGKIAQTNKATAYIYGYDNKEEIIGLNVFEFIAKKDHTRTTEIIKRTLNEGPLGAIEFTQLRKDRSEFPAEVSGNVLKDVSGNPIGLITIMKDITEHKEIEEERQKIAKLESIGTLAGGIAHDFNNILTVILGNITLAERHIEPEGKAAERLLEAKKASLRAKDLTQQMLTFARGGAPIRKIASIAELLEDSATFALRGSKVKAEFSLPDDLRSVEIDEGQMNQVITNLAINADEAMPEGGLLQIGAKNTVIKERGTLPLAKGDYVEIAVKDGGVGIAKAHLDRIFDPYFTTKQKGSGLGLATTYSIIKNHDGHITVKSKLGAGTTFYIYLPASKKPASKKKKKEAVQAVLPGKGRILVMDDEEMLREMLGNLLSADGYEVELTSDGAEAVKRYAEARESGQPFGAVILDMTIPGGMGGKETIKKLLEIDPNIIAIVSSGYSRDLVMAKYKQYGFSAVATKPYSAGELERTLQRLLIRNRT